LTRLKEEVAYLGYHLHWPQHELLALEHRQRQEWVQEVEKINRRLNDEAGG
jgi:hypothetical protein